MLTLIFSIPEIVGLPAAAIVVALYTAFNVSLSDVDGSVRTSPPFKVPAAAVKVSFKEVPTSISTPVVNVPVPLI